MTPPLSPTFCVLSTLALLFIILRTQFLFTLVTNQNSPLKDPLNLHILFVQ